MYVSIYSDNMGKQTAMSNLKRLEPYVRREMGQRVRGELGERSPGGGAKGK